jgi:hypothetical protein
MANVATALTVLVGVAFGLFEMRRARRDREERAAFAAVQALMTPEWMSSSMIVHSIPKGTTAAQLENDPRVLEACLKIATIMEGFGLCADRVAKFSPVCRVGTYACRHTEKLGVVPMAGGTTRTPQCDQDEFEDGWTNRLPRLAAVICVSSANRRTSVDGF